MNLYGTSYIPKKTFYGGDHISFGKKNLFQ